MKISALLQKYKDLSAPVKASLWYTVCNILNKALGLLTTPIFTRILTEEQYGQFSIFYSWYNIILIFTSLNVFLGSYNNGLVVSGEEDRNKLSSAFLGLTTTLTLAWGLIYIINPEFFNGIFGLTTPIMAAMFLQVLTFPALELWAARERFDYKYKKYVAVSVITAVLSIVLGIAAVTATEDAYKLEARVFSDAFSKIIFPIVFMVIIFCKGKTFFDKEYWKMALKFNIPLIPHYLSNYVLTHSDRIMIGKLAGESQAAHYSVAYTISTVMLFIVTAVNNSLIPFIYKKIHSKESGDIKKSINPIIIMMAGLSILTMVFAPEIIIIFAGKNYADAIHIVPPVAASVYFVFLYNIFSTVEYYYEKTTRIAIATMAAAVLNLILNYIGIPFGYHIAGYTTLISYIVLAIAHYVFYRMIIKETKDTDMFDKKCILVMSFVVLLVMALIALTYEYTFVRYAFVVVIAVLAVIFRKKIISAISGLKKKD